MNTAISAISAVGHSCDNSYDLSLTVLLVAVLQLYCTVLYTEINDLYRGEASGQISY